MKFLLSIAFLFAFGLSGSAQSPTADLFSGGARQIRAGQFDAALENYKTALAVAENKYANKGYRARLHYNVGVCYFHLDKFELAADHFKRAILLKTDYSLAYYALGRSKIRAQKLKANSLSEAGNFTN